MASSREEKVNEVIKSYPELFKPWIEDEDTVWLELASNPRVTLDYLGGKWKIMYPSVTYRKDGSDREITRVRRFKSLNKAINFLKGF